MIVSLFQRFQRFRWAEWVGPDDSQTTKTRELAFPKPSQLTNLPWDYASWFKIPGFVGGLDFEIELAFLIIIIMIKILVRECKYERERDHGMFDANSRVRRVFTRD